MIQRLVQNSYHSSTSLSIGYHILLFHKFSSYYHFENWFHINTFYVFIPHVVPILSYSTNTRLPFIPKIPSIRTDKLGCHSVRFETKRPEQLLPTSFAKCQQCAKQRETLSTHTVAVWNTINNILFIIAIQPSWNSTTI